MKDTTVARYSVSQLKARNGFDADESVVLGVDHDRRVEQLASALRDIASHQGHDSSLDINAKNMRDTAREAIGSTVDGGAES